MPENTDQENSEYGHFSRSVAVERLTSCVHRTASFHTRGKVTARSFNSSPSHGSLQLNENQIENHRENQYIGRSCKKKKKKTARTLFSARKKLTAHPNLGHAILNTKSTKDGFIFNFRIAH